MPEPDADLDRLVAAHLDDALDDADARQLHDRLRAEPAARQTLLAAARQASALPRLALAEAPAPRPVATVTVKPRTSALRFALLATTIAAALAITITAIGMSGRSEHDLRIDGDSARIEREGNGRSAAGDPWLRPGDRIDAGGAPARLAWSSESTVLTLGADARLVVEASAGAKRLRLERGSLVASVAHQPRDGGLTVATAFGAVEVVGTEFGVRLREGVCDVDVERGSVRLVPRPGAPAVMLEAGFSASCDGRSVSPPGPLAAVPATDTAPLAASTHAARSMRLDAGDWRAVSGAGWEGDLIDGKIRARTNPEGRVARITTPVRRPDGYLTLDGDFRCAVRVAVDRPTTLAVLLVCDAPQGAGAWAGNLQAERHVGAGDQEIALTFADLRLATPGAPLPAGCRVVALAVMCWPAATLDLEWIRCDQ